MNQNDYLILESFGLSEIKTNEQQKELLNRIFFLQDNVLDNLDGR